MNHKKMFNIKVLLVFSLLILSSINYLFLSKDQIITIVQKEYIFLGVLALLYMLFYYYKIKLKNLTIIEYIPNLNYIDIKSTIVFFFIFQIVDYYYEDGFIGMISQWFTYWIFGVIAWLVTHNINYYKNYKFYKYDSLTEHRL